MKIVVISPESEEPREHAVLAELFAAGLTDYHLRKPGWPREAIAAWLRALPCESLRRIILHSHHDLAAEFPAIGGLHHRDPANSICHLISDKMSPGEVIDNKSKVRICNSISDKYSGMVESRAVHGLGLLRAGLDEPVRLLVSPVFPSFSKPGHGPAFELTELRDILALPRRAEVIALGGIDASRLPVCRDLGFDGAAVLGAIWQSADPLRAFGELSRVAAEVTRLNAVIPSSLVTSAAT